MSFDQIAPIAPVHFFALQMPVLRRDVRVEDSLDEKCLLPSLEDLCTEENFAHIYLAWSKEGIHCEAAFQSAFTSSYYPRIDQGDSIELMIDSRDVKAPFNTRFCHHFVFLPKEVDGHQAVELTKFRTEDRHDLCDPAELFVKRLNSKRIKIFIPSRCLVGYDPEQFRRLGFTYKINRFNGAPQHFAAVSDDFQIEQQPALWSSLRLVDSDEDSII